MAQTAQTGKRFALLTVKIINIFARCVAVFTVNTVNTIFTLKHCGVNTYIIFNNGIDFIR